MKQIEYYVTDSGKCPFHEWLCELSISFQVRIEKRINRLKDGLYGDCKKLSNSQLSELRFDFGKGYRVYYKDLDDKIIIILAGSDKSDQIKVIKQANIYYEEYLRSKEHANN